MTDRAILHTSLYKLEHKQRNEFSKAILKKLKKAEYPVNTMTFYNDKGFADHTMVADALQINTYFTLPITSLEKEQLKT